MAFLFFILFIIAALFFAILIFSSKRLSPIPYFPSQKVDLHLIIKSLNLKNDQVIFDLGAGDGIVIFTAAKEAIKKNLNTKFIAVDINPILILILHIRRFFHPNKKNVKIVWTDFFRMNYKLITDNRKLITFYLYISPWYLEKAIENCKLKIKNFSVVSYMYPIKSLKKKEKIIWGKNAVFVYN